MFGTEKGLSWRKTRRTIKRNQNSSSEMSVFMAFGWRRNDDPFLGCSSHFSLETWQNMITSNQSSINKVPSVQPFTLQFFLHFIHFLRNTSTPSCFTFQYFCHFPMILESYSFSLEIWKGFPSFLGCRWLGNRHEWHKVLRKNRVGILKAEEVLRESQSKTMQRMQWMIIFLLLSFDGSFLLRKNEWMNERWWKME